LIGGATYPAGVGAQPTCCTNCPCNTGACALRNFNLPCCGPNTQCAHHVKP
jgi:hypothetical protein